MRISVHLVHAVNIIPYSPDRLIGNSNNTVGNALLNNNYINIAGMQSTNDNKPWIIVNNKYFIYKKYILTIKNNTNERRKQSLLDMLVLPSWIRYHIDINRHREGFGRRDSTYTGRQSHASQFNMTSFFTSHKTWMHFRKIMLLNTNGVELYYVHQH